MRPVLLFALTFLVTVSATVRRADALSDAESEKMLTGMVHSYFESDPDKFWEICTKFENPQFQSNQEIRAWMEDRLAPQWTYSRIKSVIVQGIARITSEKLGKIEFRFDGLQNAPSRVIVVTAWVDRVIEFDEPVPPEHRKIYQEAILKIYVTLIEERLVSFKSDEINFGYRFAGNE